VGELWTIPWISPDHRAGLADARVVGSAPHSRTSGALASAARRRLGLDHPARRSRGA